MSHHIYNTKGIVLSSFPIGESDKLFKIFTRELGLIDATAQGVRKIESKNRYGLQDFSVSDISLVRGREIWRITNVSSGENIFSLLKNNRQKLDSFSKIILLVQRLVHGEEKNEELFDLLFEALNFLKNTDIGNQDYKNFDLIVSIKILNNLGYFDKNIQKDKLEIFLKKPIERSFLKEMEEISFVAEQEISKSLEETHLL
ncbi:DNA repair protein RecO [Candidatus Campbellbacteria bacterium RIFCSPLOWO2_02_FULL_35_11]|uniref:DNA repair protein RecO n=2 Tax=Candidatus Campbelliibacteriota TaxID=1752727 RepID=A0A1F5EQD1_9BACT|nr:MAG: DNA repair protein RecO [Candidatus Campbellbacteria bacterium RIFCSPHIGHO2_12_FULL_35_10]OGD70790.1 MAG: DNA repair protein RecO [Candidatus Campbellbacteria bacterium RIFCSPLOWO2_02_FULL_35_11]